MNIVEYRELASKLESFLIKYENSSKDLQDIKRALFIQSRENILVFKKISKIVDNIIQNTNILTTREAFILKQRFCKNKKYIKTYRELSEELDITFTRVRQIEAKAISKIVD